MEALLILLLVACFSLSQCGFPTSSLRHVSMLYRHGDRSPVSIYPNDKNQIGSWPDGLGWLSSIGIQQHRALGQYIKNRYGGFIDESRYYHQEIAIESSAVPRCLMSAYSNLAGLFPPQGDQVWDPSLLWQPIPVTSVPLEEDNKLAISAPCPRYDQLLIQTFMSNEVKQYQEDNKDFMNHVAEMAGYPEGNLSTSMSVSDTLVCEQAHNMTMDDWVYEDDTFDKLLDINLYGWNLLYNNTEMARLRGGPLLKEIIDTMNFAISNSSLPKIHMYSAHDSTVSALLSAMMVNNDQRPPYASVVFVELHEMLDSHFVTIYFRNETNQEPYYFLPPGCGDPCELETFEAVMQPNLPENWVEECKLVPNRPDNLPVPRAVMALIIACAILAFAIGLGTLILWLSRDEGSRYTPVA